MSYEKIIIPDQQDGNVLVVQPELLEFKKYVKLAKENKFCIELDICFLYENEKSLREIENILTIHLRNNYHHNKINLLFKDIKFALGFNPKFIILHDHVLGNIDCNELATVNRYLKKNNTTILLENYKYTRKTYNKLYKNLLLTIPGIKKCIDWGHCILMKEDIDKWIDNNVVYLHLNNNFGVYDTHNSIYNGKGIISKKIIKKINSIKYISLEVNVKYKTYYNNILYMLENKIPPFTGFIINLPIYQKYIISEVKKFISLKLNTNIIYSFIYGSFARNNCHEGSDLDLFLCTKGDFDKRVFIKEYKKICKSLGFTIDSIYPIELFSEIDINNILDNKTTELSKEDIEEIKNAHLMKSIFLCGDKKKYFKNIKRYNDL